MRKLHLDAMFLTETTHGDHKKYLTVWQKTNLHNYTKRLMHRWP